MSELETVLEDNARLRTMLKNSEDALSQQSEFIRSLQKECAELARIGNERASNWLDAENRAAELQVRLGVQNALIVQGDKMRLQAQVERDEARQIAAELSSVDDMRTTGWCKRCGRDTGDDTLTCTECWEHGL